MRCSKCGEALPDDTRFCPVCGHKLQSGREASGGEPAASGEAPPTRGVLRFQGWLAPERGSGPYIEACLYALILTAGVIWYLVTGVSWPLYLLFVVVTLLAWLRRV